MKYTPPHSITIKERFLECVHVGSQKDCWEWKKPRKNGYGRFRLMGRVEGAHRASWILHKGPIPPGIFVCHHCDNPPCVNPKHLFLGTSKDNVQDSLKKGRFNKKRQALFTPEQAEEIRSNAVKWPRGTYGMIVIEHYEGLAKTYNAPIGEIISAVYKLGPYGTGSKKQPLTPYVPTNLKIPYMKRVVKKEVSGG